MHVHRPAPDVTALSDVAEIPGLGFLPVNAYVLHAAELAALLNGPAVGTQATLF